MKWLTDTDLSLRLSGYGVHPHEFLALVQFLPRTWPIYTAQDKEVEWKQTEYGHPANWRQDAAQFAISTVTDIAVKIQHAAVTPRAYGFGGAYDLRIRAIKDGVQVHRVLIEEGDDFTAPPTVRYKTLNTGDSLLGEYIEGVTDATTP